MPDVGGIAGDRLKAFIERIERLEDEKKALNEDIKEVFAEAKGTGFEVRIMREILKLRKMDKDDIDEQEALIEVYKRALGMIPDFEPELPLGEGGSETARGEAGVRAAAKRFVNSVAREPGSSVAIEFPDGRGVSIKNVGGKKVVEQIGEGG